MLTELRVVDFAIIDQLHLSLRPGLTVLTGETGAGKSIVVDAVSTLLGGRAEAEWIRSGADRTLVEGTFTLDPRLRESLRPLLESDGLNPEGDALTVGRDARREGRNVCRIEGRSVSLRQLQAVGERLIDIHGQGEHLSLLRVREHIDLLDRFGGLLPLRHKVADEVRALQEVRRELDSLRMDERELARRVDRLEYITQEIRAAKLRPGEEEELLLERNRLANAEHLQSLADTAYSALYETRDDQQSALDLLAGAEQAMAGLARYDPSWADKAGLVRESASQLQDLARELRIYRDETEFNPARLEKVEERLDLISNLKRKYGGTIQEVLRFGERAAAELQSITHSEERIGALEAAEDTLLRKIGSVAQELSERRAAAAGSLSQKVEEQLAQLGMQKAHFGVDMHRDASPVGAWIGDERFAFDATGVDRLEFLVAANPGEPLKPLARTASGGETSRLMLALKAVLSEADEMPTLIFDEIDVGIGGRAGMVVGRKLWELGRRHQVLCVTHLPQIACFADTHLCVTKLEEAGRTVSRVRPLVGDERIVELAQMLGAVTESTQRSVAELIQAVETAKRKAGVPA